MVCTETMIDDFPRELWQIILDSNTWDRSELRILRLTSKPLLSCSTPLLFKHVVLRPNTNSLARAMSIARHEHLAQHVRTLHRRGDVVCRWIRNVEEFRREVQRTWPLEADKQAICANAERFWKKIPRMQKKQAVYRDIDHFEAISNLCNRLLNLIALDFSSRPNPKSAWSGQFGSETQCCGNLKFDEQVRLCHIVEPRPTTLYRVEAQYFWTSSIRNALEQYWSTGLNKLRHLDIGFHFYSPRDDRQFLPDHLRDFFKAAQTVEHLVLGFEECCRDPGGAYDRFTSVLLDSTWPQLRKLHLVWMSAQLVHMIRFLDRHKTLLRNLTFENLLPCSERDHDQWLVECPTMHIVCYIRDELRLESFHIRGYIGNPSWEFYNEEIDWQLFHATDTGEYSDRLQRIQRFALCKGDFPFPGHERLFDRDLWPEQYYPEHDVGIQRLAWNKDSEDDEDYPMLGVAPAIADVMAPFLDDSWRLCNGNEL